MADIPQLMPIVASTLAGATLLMTVGLGGVLTFHWLRYAMNLAATTIAVALYFLVSLFLLLGMFTSLGLILTV